MAALYFISYALIATIIALVIAYAQYIRMKRENVPMNLGFLKVVTAIALTMWAAAGVTSISYAYAA